MKPYLPFTKPASPIHTIIMPLSSSKAPCDSHIETPGQLSVDIPGTDHYLDLLDSTTAAGCPNNVSGYNCSPSRGMRIFPIELKYRSSLLGALGFVQIP